MHDTAVVVVGLLHIRTPNPLLSSLDASKHVAELGQSHEWHGVDASASAPLLVTWFRKQLQEFTC